MPSLPLHSSIHQVKHLVPLSSSSQPGDCERPLKSSPGISLGMYGLAYTLKLILEGKIAQDQYFLNAISNLQLLLVRAPYLFSRVLFHPSPHNPHIYSVFNLQLSIIPEPVTKLMVGFLQP